MVLVLITHFLWYVVQKSETNEWIELEGRENGVGTIAGEWQCPGTWGGRETLRIWSRFNIYSLESVVFWCGQDVSVLNGRGGWSEIHQTMRFAGKCGCHAQVWGPKMNVRLSILGEVEYLSSYSCSKLQWEKRQVIGASWCLPTILQTAVIIQDKDFCPPLVD